MAAIVVTKGLGVPLEANGVRFIGPLKVADANETNLSTPDTSVVLDTRGVSLLRLQLIFANYTSVTLKAQRSVDGTNYIDITDATTSLTNTSFAFDPQAPYVRLSIAGTLSGSADTLSVFAYAEYMR